MNKTLEILYIISMVIAGVFIGYAMDADGRKQDIKEFQIEAILNDCGYWNIDGIFEWKDPDMEGLHEVQIEIPR